MNKLKRLGEILYAMDTYDVFEFYKLTGASALQFLIFDIGFITEDLNFDLDTNLDVSKVNEIRNLVNQVLPQLLQKKNFTIDVKLTKLTGKLDTYVIKDNLSSDIFKLNFNYLNRVHVLNPEYFARKDSHFEDLHIYALSNLENYARYIVEFLEGKYGDKILNDLITNKKVLPQQYPFLRKIIAFYMSISDNYKGINLNQVDKRLQDLLFFNDKELKYLKDSQNGIFDLSLILPPTMSNKLQNHPSIKMLRVVS